MNGVHAFGAASMGGPADAVRSCGLDPDETLPFLRQILSEDVGGGDITSDAVIPSAASGEFAVVAKSQGTLAGVPLAAAIFWIQDRRLEIELPIADGAPVKSGDILLTVAGSVRSILAAERVALNLLGRLSGIASLTARFVAQVAASRARVLDTRKTGLGTRMLDKYAVRLRRWDQSSDRALRRGPGKGQPHCRIRFDRRRSGPPAGGRAGRLRALRWSATRSTRSPNAWSWGLAGSCSTTWTLVRWRRRSG